MRDLLLDQGLPARAAGALRDLGWDAVHVREIGMREADDAEILAHAANEERVVVTLDRDFPQILALTEAALPSVILIRKERLRAAGVVALLKEVFERHEQSLRRGCVLSVGTYGTRVRLLPLK